MIENAVIKSNDCVYGWWIWIKKQNVCKIKKLNSNSDYVIFSQFYFEMEGLSETCTPTKCLG